MAYLIDVDFANTIVDEEHYETLELYRSSEPVFANLTRHLIPAEWIAVDQGIWCHARPPKLHIPTHGWKIHISACPRDAKAILATTVRLLVE